MSESQIEDFIIDDSLVEIIHFFVEHQLKELEDIETAYNNQDYEQVQRLGHSLKGAGANYRLDSLSKIGSHIESNCKLRNYDMLPALIKKYKVYMDKLSSQI